MPKYEISFLINPISGGGLGKQVYHRLPEIMSSFGYSKDNWQACFTEKNNLAEKTTRLLETSKRIIAVGGDGTIGLILGCLQEQEYDAEIGLIPLGTGNDLARTLGIYDLFQRKGLLACINRLIKAQSTEFDLWSVNGVKTLSSYLSCGMDAAILHDFNLARLNNRLHESVIANKIFYLKFAAARYRHRIKSGARLRLCSGGREESVDIGGACSCLVGNVSSYAAGSAPFKKAEFNDGKLDVIIFRNLWIYLVIVGISRFFPWIRHMFPGPFSCYEAESIVLENIQDEFIQLDGEDITGTISEGTLKVLPGRKVKLLDLRKAPFGIF